jgi:hypothetical protein
VRPTFVFLKQQQQSRSWIGLGSNCLIMLRHAGSAPSVASNSKSQQPSDGSSSQAHLLGLAEAAAGAGDVEVSYLLYAKGCLGTAADTSPSSRFTAGMLHSLAAMCQPPTTTAAAAAATPKRWQQMTQRLLSDSLSGVPSHPTTAGAAFSKSRSSPALAGVGPTTASSSSSRPGRRVFCASDLHVDRAGGANLAWMKSISSSNFRHDVLIVAGELITAPLLVDRQPAASSVCLRTISQTCPDLYWL